MKVVVVGGVAAGMSAAARLRRLNENAEIIVFERDEYISFANCGLPYHIRGDIDHWYAEDYPGRTSDGRLIDVRSRREYEEWHVESAVNLPITELRQRLDELDTSEAAYVYCKSGFRGYLAYRILKQRGFSKVQNLSGGLQTFHLHHRICEGCPEIDIPFITYAEDREGSTIGD